MMAQLRAHMDGEGMQAGHLSSRSRRVRQYQATAIVERLREMGDNLATAQKAVAAAYGERPRTIRQWRSRSLGPTQLASIEKLLGVLRRCRKRKTVLAVARELAGEAQRDRSRPARAPEPLSS